MEYFLFLLLFLCVFWIYQFTQLMLLQESDFPGRHDKVLWCAAFVLAFALAPFAFFLWKRVYPQVRCAEKDSDATSEREKTRT